MQQQQEMQQQQQQQREKQQHVQIQKTRVIRLACGLHSSPSILKPTCRPSCGERSFRVGQITWVRRLTRGSSWHLCLHLHVNNPWLRVPLRVVRSRARWARLHVCRSPVRQLEHLRPRLRRRQRAFCQLEGCLHLHVHHPWLRVPLRVRSQARWARRRRLPASSRSQHAFSCSSPCRHIAWLGRFGRRGRLGWLWTSRTPLPA